MIAIEELKPYRISVLLLEADLFQTGADSTEEIEQLFMASKLEIVEECVVEDDAPDLRMTATALLACVPGMPADAASASHAEFLRSPGASASSPHSLAVLAIHAVDSDPTPNSYPALTST